MFLGFFVTRYHELAFFSRFCFLTIFFGGNCYLIHGIKVVSVLSLHHNPSGIYGRIFYLYGISICFGTCFS